MVVKFGCPRPGRKAAESLRSVYRRPSNAAARVRATHSRYGRTGRFRSPVGARTDIAVGAPVWDSIRRSCRSPVGICLEYDALTSIRGKAPLHARNLPGAEVPAQRLILSGCLAAVERHATIAQADVRAAGDDDVVEHGNVQQPAGGDRLSGQVQVVRRWLRVA